MQVLLIAVVAVVLVGLGLLSVLIDVFDRGAKSFAEARKVRELKKRAQQAFAETNRALALAAAEQAQLEAFRSQNPARLVGMPNPDAYRRTFAMLDDFTSLANAYRPSLPENLDRRFQACKFPSSLFELARPHPAAFSQTEPPPRKREAARAAPTKAPKVPPSLPLFPNIDEERSV